MAKRVMNFNPGPAALPLAALERAQREMLDFEGTGMSIVEHSHRGKAFGGVHEEAIALLRNLLDVPSNFHVLLLQGGARLQFAMVPYNFIRDDGAGAYTITGNWARQAHKEATKIRSASVAASTEATGFSKVPTAEDFDLDDHANYLHLTSNNTLYGTQWPSYPETNTPLVGDLTSDLLSRPLPLERFGLVYAGAQKNVGPAGVTVVIIRDDFLAQARTDLPDALRYAVHADKNSLWNTPPAFAIYLLRNTLSAYADLGGLDALVQRNQEKARLLYETIDRHPDFYRAPVERASRSTMNAVFRLPTEDLEKEFLDRAQADDMVGLKGHRSVGGIRVSMYNAVEPAWIETLCTFMRSFADKHAG